MDGLSQQDRILKLLSLRYPEILDVRKDTLLQVSGMIASFLKYHAADGREDGYFDAFFPQKASPEWKKLLGASDGNTAPLLSVLINFIENLNLTGNLFNERWKTFPGWYLQNVLGVKRRPLQGDKVWVCFEGNHKDTIYMSGQTRFKAERGAYTDYYLLPEDTEVHNVVLDGLYLMLCDKKTGAGNDAPVKSISLQQMQLENGFVKGMAPVATDIGIRISAPSLVLKEGTRQVQVTLYAYTNTEATYVSDKTADEPLTDAFNLSISTGDGWTDIKSFLVREKNGNIEFTFYLPDSFPPTDYCVYEKHYCDTIWPSLRICLNPSIAADIPLITGFCYSRVKIATTASGLTDIKIYNELGKIDNSKPFTPFGISSEKGAWFTIGNYEINLKDTKRIYLHLYWMQLPSDASGLSGYYADYHKKITNNTFKVSVRYLSDFQWKSVTGADTFPLFASQGNTQLLSDRTVVGPVDVDKMPVVDIPEKNYEYSLKSRSGFLNFILSAPEMGFGASVYRQIFTEQLIRNARRKRKEPTIMPPLQPVVKRITLDYEAEDFVEIGHADQGERMVPVVPLDAVPVADENSAGEHLALMPDIPERNLLLAFRNIGPGMQLSLFFDVAPVVYKMLTDDSLYEERDKLRDIRMYIGNPHNWNRMPLSFIRRDETMGLLISGLIRLQFPETLVPSLYDGRGRLWLKISYNNIKEIAFPAIKSVFVNAVQLERAPESTDMFPLPNTEDGILSEDTKIPGLGIIRRITPFYDGRQEETDTEMQVRMAEYAAHKGRAVTPMDYERLVMQAFPAIAKVKCITNQKGMRGTNKVSLVVIPYKKGIHKEAVYPLVPPHMLFSIEKYMRNLASAYVRGVNVLNPVYEEIVVRCCIVTKGYFSVKQRKRLVAMINQFIAPWYYNNSLPAFDYTINLEEIHDALIREFGSLITISDFATVQIERKRKRYVLHDFSYKKSGKIIVPSSEAGEKVLVVPRQAHGILMPSVHHIFYWDKIPDADDFGIHEMGIGESFIVSGNKSK